MSGFTEKPRGAVASPTAAFVSEGPTLASCHCTGRCRQRGYCPCAPDPYSPPPCGHYFPWYGVIPPDYCPLCGAYIGAIRCPSPPHRYPYVTYTVHT